MKYMGSAGKLFSPIVLIFAGTLLTLAGLGLIEITRDLLLYLGLSLVLIAIASIFIATRNKKSGGEIEDGPR